MSMVLLPQRSSAHRDSHWPALVWRLVVCSCAAMALFFLIVPLNPGGLGHRLDDSWAWAMNEAVARGFAFGRDIIFNLGPYASVYTRVFHPATDGLMMGASAALALCYVSVVLWLSWDRPAWLVGYAALIIGFWYSANSVFIPSRDALLFAYPLLLGGLVAKVVEGFDPAKGNSRLFPVVLAVLFSPLGLLPLVKGSQMFYCAAIMLVAGAALWQCRRSWAVAAAAGAAASGVVSWILAGQSLVDLAAYARGTMWITSGYSEALANDGPFSEIAAYLLASVILLWTAVRGMPRRTGWCFGVCLALFLFVTFKASFVRHDGFHAAIALASLVFGVLAIGMLRKSFPVQALLLLATLMTACSFMRYQSVLLEEAEQKGPAEVQEASQMSMSALGRRAVSALIRETDLNARRMLADVEAGIRLRRAPGTRLEQRFEADRQAIHALMKIPAFVDGADIYSFEQAHLLASGTRWQPRPTFQSYQAYDRLMRLNAEHLTSIAAPEHVLLRVAPIDGHLPSLEDGPSWRMLLAAYQPDGMVAGFVHLRKRAQPLSYTESPLSEQHASMGESIALPASGGLVWARIDVEPTWFGRLWATGFKPPQLTMQVELTTGETKEFRVLSNMMREGFLLAPFVSDTDGFMALALSGEAGSSLSRVVRLSIAPAYGAGVLWQSAYSLSLSR